MFCNGNSIMLFYSNAVHNSWPTGLIVEHFLVLHIFLHSAESE